MKTVRETVHVLVAGGGTAGHIAAIQSSRAGAVTSVIEAGSMLGGTMTAGGVYTPNHYHSPSGPVVLGIPWELYSNTKKLEGLPVPDPKQRRPIETPGYYSYVSVPIYVALAEAVAIEAGVIVHYHEFVSQARAVGDQWEITSLGRGIRRITNAKELIDCTGDADVVRMLGLKTLHSETRQPGSYQYKIENIEHEQIWQGEVQALYEQAVKDGAILDTDFAYRNSQPFKYFLDFGGHNASHIVDADTSDAEGQTQADLQGRAGMLRMFRFVQRSIPGCERAILKTMYARAVSRETYRVLGEYVVSKDDFMKAVDFEDKICNAFNYVDMHSKNGCEEVFLEPGQLIPKVPFRALIPRGSSRITVAGRIVSAERWALAGIRAQCTCMAMGQAMGAAAALAVQRNMPSREIDSKDIVALTVEHGAVAP